MNRLRTKNNGSSDSSFFPLTRQSLIVRLGNRSRTESEKAWDEFFAIYSPLIYRMARHEGLAPEAAEEVVATVMRNFASSVRSGFAPRSRFRNYLRSITNRQIRREKKRLDGAVRLSDLGHEPASAIRTANDYWEDLEQQERWRVCLERLKTSPAIRPRDWSAFEDLVINDQKVKTVASRYGLTENRVYGIKHKLIKELQRMKLRLDVELGEA